MELMIETLLISGAVLAFLTLIIPALALKRQTGNAFVFAGLAFLALWIVLRSFVTGHAPFSGAYESIVFFMFLYSLKIGLFSTFPSKIKAALLIPAILSLTGALLLPPELKIPNPLVAALQSFWIFIHVPGIFIGYVSLTIGFILALLEKFGSRQVSAYLENEMRFAFFFIAFGIITGGAWAQLTWGSFWNWDPKETFALITWVWLCLERHFKTKRVRRALIFAAFVSMLFTYIGVMFFLPGLHSYR
jgi:ABC-type transport system involved in cytochrome c biogenesis permease subunit